MEALHPAGVVGERAVALRVGRDREHDARVLDRLAPSVSSTTRYGTRSSAARACSASHHDVRSVRHEHERLQRAGLGSRQQRRRARPLGGHALQHEPAGVRVLVGLDQQVVVVGVGRRPRDAGHGGAQRIAELPQQVDLLVRRLRRHDDRPPRPGHGRAPQPRSRSATAASASFQSAGTNASAPRTSGCKRRPSPCRP